jgi:hypothetical protein
MKNAFFGSTAAAILFMAVSSTWAEEPYSLEWIRQIGTNQSDSIDSVYVDGAANLYLTLITAGSLAGPSLGGSDVYVLKYNSAGDLLWSRQIGTEANDGGGAVTVDVTGNLYIGGVTQGSLAGPNQGVNDVFLLKYDPAGNLLWSRQFGTERTEHGVGLAADSVGNVYVNGDTFGNLGGTAFGDYDLYITKFSASGDQLWVRQLGGTEADYSTGLTLDAAGNPYITGQTRNSLGGPQHGSEDGVIVKFDASGNQLWSRQDATPYSDIFRSPAADSDGNVYVAGGTDLESGSSDARLLKYSPSGDLLWSRQFGSDGRDGNGHVAVDSAGNAYFIGNTDGDFGGPNAGSFDAYLAKFDASGTQLWSRQIGTAARELTSPVAVDAAGAVFMTGITRGDLGGPNAGSDDAFLAKFSDRPIPEPSTLVLTALGLVAVGGRSLRHSKPRKDT